ncbi:hypothetical protein A3D07_04295 [Candidatus Curtissbacteria bacterium RIFCSPHIGHO2_02_FULL_42_15]|uniref:CopG family transcriptional regulator n=1 Tax=Candidatus Curtissbacteria bacterium RIFCSPHIGHO2_02_FULL_42_15 TaxID=1797716 RepID=A0A1F5GGR0_9BACT|nr:MAG: hypothetical protein A3D07_04295 [Candidatus Curtissbacteria bacterium RIFCSPHIGHO2_02_FULL_42_15]
MQQTTRTTIRIRKDLLNISREYALKRGVSLQDTVNAALAAGFQRISDLESRKQAMAKIDQFRESLSGKKINLQEILQESKKDLK